MASHSLHLFARFTLSLIAMLVCCQLSTAKSLVDCSGCVGEGGGVAYASCPGGDYVYIEVVPSSGTCVTSKNSPVTCGDTPCAQYVSTEWQQSAGTTVNRCLYRFGTWYCQYPPITADGTVQYDWRYQDQGCNDERYTYRISAVGSCGLTLEASIAARCTECAD